MSELSFEQMLDESFKTIHNGEVVEGTVIDVKPEEIILNIGYKADGIITKSEYSNDQSVDLTEAVKVGDAMTVKVLKVNTITVKGKEKRVGRSVGRTSDWKKAIVTIDTDPKTETYLGKGGKEVKGTKKFKDSIEDFTGV